MTSRSVLTACLIGLLIVANVAWGSERQSNLGVGLQGNLPLWGGLSIKYTGFEKVHFQFIEHYVQSGDEYSAMVGFQAPLIVADYSWSRVYIAPGIGFRRTKERQMYYVSAYEGMPDGAKGIPDDASVVPVDVRPAEVYSGDIRRLVTEDITGGALLFGTEVFLDRLFGSDSSRYSLNIEFGQGIGQLDRQAACEWPDSTSADCEELYNTNPWLRDDESEKETSGMRASFVIGFGFHIYF